VTAEFALSRCASLYRRENILQLIDNSCLEIRHQLQLSRAQLHSTKVA